MKVIIYRRVPRGKTVLEAKTLVDNGTTLGIGLRENAIQVPKTNIKKVKVVL